MKYKKGGEGVRHTEVWFDPGLQGPVLVTATISLPPPETPGDGFSVFQTAENHFDDGRTQIVINASYVGKGAPEGWDVWCDYVIMSTPNFPFGARP